MDDATRQRAAPETPDEVATRVRAARRRQRSGLLAQLLGDEWQEVEPGIYRLVVPRPNDGPSSTGPPQGR